MSTTRTSAFRTASLRRWLKGMRSPWWRLSRGADELPPRTTISVLLDERLGDRLEAPPPPRPLVPILQPHLLRPLDVLLHAIGDGAGHLAVGDAQHVLLVQLH